MNSNNHIKPLFSRKFTLDRRTACQSLLKYNPKNFSQLKVHINTGHPSYLQNFIPAFLKIAPRLKSLHKINFETSCDHAYIKHVLLIKIAKLFYRIKHLALPIFFQNSLNMQAAIAWAEGSRNLSSFSSSYFTAGFYFQNMPNLVKGFIELNYHLRRHKLKKLQLATWIDQLRNPTLKRLPSLEQYIIKYNPDLEERTIYQKVGIYQKKIFPKLYRLKELEVSNFRRVSAAAHILDAFPRPENVQSLGFHFHQLCESNYRTCSQFKWSLRRFQNLKRFKLEFDVVDPFFMIIESLEQSLLLEELELRFYIQPKSMIFDQLANFICKFQNLNHLKLVFKVSSDFPVEVWKAQLIFLLKQIGNLHHLKSLSLWVFGEEGKELEIFDGGVLALTQAIRKLKILQRLDLGEFNGNFTNEFPQLIEGLTENSSNFEKLEMCFGDQNLEHKDLMAFAEVLKNMINLNSLNLSGLSITNVVFWKRLFKNLFEARRLKKVSLKGGMIKMEKKLLIDLIKLLSSKKGLKRLRISYSAVEWTGESSDEKIDLAEIFQKHLNLSLHLWGALRHEILMNKDLADKIMWS